MYISEFSVTLLVYFLNTVNYNLLIALHFETFIYFENLQTTSFVTSHSEK